MDADPAPFFRPDVTRRVENLVDVAQGKPAAQSSLSEWSRPGEAMAAVSGDFPADYAFHTDFEDNPWWQVDLGDVYPIEVIVIHNRVGLLQERARRLRVEIAAATGEWVLVHAGYAQFGGGGNGAPLELWIGGELDARHVRISLDGREYLHLARVGIFTKAAFGPFRTFCRRHGLPAFDAGESRTGCEYVLESADGSDGGEVIGLKINYSGRFGNLLHQYINAIKFAKATQLRYIQLGWNELLDVRADFSVGGLTFLGRDSPLPAGGVFLSGEFFNSDDLMPVLGPFLRFSREEERAATAIAQAYIRPHMLTGLPLPDEDHPADELTIHLRSGDIFASDHPVTYGYRQPPLSFYILVIERMRASGRINRVRLVFEDRGNPCVDALESWLAARDIPTRVTSGSLHQDMSALIDAPHLVFGHGTFGYAACRLSRAIETVHFFAPELGGSYGHMPTIRDVVKVSDRDGKYIKAYEYGRPFGAEEGWRNTPEMREIMLTYPIDALAVEELPRALRAPG